MLPLVFLRPAKDYDNCSHQSHLINRLAFAGKLLGRNHLSKVELFSNLVLLAFADGKFTQEEVTYLAQKAEKWNISADDVETAFAGASTGEADIIIPELRDDRTELLKEMIRLMAVDGHLADVEKRLCATASAAMDFNGIEFDDLLKSVLHG